MYIYLYKGEEREILVLNFKLAVIMVILINDRFNYRLIKYATFRFNFSPLETTAIILTVGI